MYISDLLDSFRHDFQTFGYSNNVIGAATGIAIGSSSKQFVEDSLQLVVLPILIYIVKLFRMHKLHGFVLKYVSQKFLTTLILTAGKLSWTILNWVLTLILTFIIMEYILNRWIIGVKTTIKDGDKLTYIKAKADAKNSDIIPNQEQIHIIKKQEAEEDKLGKKLLLKDEKKIISPESNEQHNQPPVQYNEHNGPPEPNPNHTTNLKFEAFSENSLY